MPSYIYKNLQSMPDHKDSLGGKPSAAKNNKILLSLGDEHTVCGDTAAKTIHKSIALKRTIPTE